MNSPVISVSNLIIKVCKHPNKNALRYSCTGVTRIQPFKIITIAVIAEIYIIPFPPFTATIPSARDGYL